MRLTGHHPQYFIGIWVSCYCYRLRTTRIVPPRTLTNHTPIHQIMHWRIHHTEHRLAMLDQRNIHSEVTIALNKFFSAIKRINQPIALPAKPRLHSLRIGFFR